MAFPQHNSLKNKKIAGQKSRKGEEEDGDQRRTMQPMSASNLKIAGFSFELIGPTMLGFLHNRPLPKPLLLSHL